MVLVIGRIEQETRGKGKKKLTTNSCFMRDFGNVPTVVRG